MVVDSLPPVSFLVFHSSPRPLALTGSGLQEAVGKPPRNL